MEEYKNYVICELDKILTNKEIVKNIEKSISNYTKERTPKKIVKNAEKNAEKNTEQEPEDETELQIYKQCFMKVIYTLKHNKNKQHILDRLNNLADSKLSLDFVQLPRDVIDPEKWEKLYKLRTDDVKRKKGLHKCPKCKGWFTEHSESQRASADESMCIFVTCLDCSHHFKYS
jgi:DNA-directed RNA polymerase subunit M/transcription elongation factor TFIIS